MPRSSRGPASTSTSVASKASSRGRPEGRGPPALLDVDPLSPDGRSVGTLLDPMVQERAERHELLPPSGPHVRARLVRKDAPHDALDLVADPLGGSLQPGESRFELFDPRFQRGLVGHVVPPTPASGGIPNWIFSVRSSNVAPCVGALSSSRGRIRLRRNAPTRTTSSSALRVSVTSLFDTKGSSIARVNPPPVRSTRYGRPR